METTTYTVVKIENNPNMGMECYYKRKIKGKMFNVCFFIDTHNWIKVGDTVKLQKDSTHNTRKIWVNGRLKESDLFNRIHNEAFQKAKKKFPWLRHIPLD